MKVLHICITDEGGAGLCCRRLHHAIKDLGITSYVLTLLKYSDDSDVMRAPKGWRWALWGIVNKTLECLHLPLTDKLKVRNAAQHNDTTLTMPVTAFKTLHHHLLIQWADIIHLHGVAGFVDYPSFFTNVDKPIVWTQHDEILFSGLSHFGYTPKELCCLEKKYYHIKLQAIHSVKHLGIVFLSKMMYERFHTHEMVRGCYMTVINNPVDINEFRPIERIKARRKLGIPSDATVFVFVATNIADSRKRLHTLCDALQGLALPNLLLLAVGNTSHNEQWPDFVKAIGPMRGSKELSVAYSAADYFISASLHEAFAQTPIEAMACGIPAIVTPVSGTYELIKDTNGVRCKGFSTADIVEGIRTAINRSYDAKKIRTDMFYRFSPKYIAEKYVVFYQEMIENNRKFKNS